jgi:D-3-phosphoglycerate dehydrogenase
MAHGLSSTDRPNLPRRPISVFITDYSFANLDPEHAALDPLGCAITAAQCKTDADVLAGAREADVLLVQWAPLTANVLENLPRCRLVVRYGIGVDNVDLAAASRLGIPVCNVPDYSVDEVADHAMATALALGRQLIQIDRRVHSGVWKLAPVTPMPAFRQMTFGVAGIGRIGRAVLDRARAFKFKLIAYDPMADDKAFSAAGAKRVDVETLFAESDILSLHAPLTPDTQHFVRVDRLARMKPTAILVNTARGALVDVAALADALGRRQIAYAGLDVFESEPLPANHPIRNCDNALLTSHVAWYSERSLGQLQRLAAEEVARFARGEPLRHRVNP